jgi:hypothetical protein
MRQARLHIVRMFNQLALGFLTVAAASCDRGVRFKRTEVAAAPNAISSATAAGSTAPFVVHRPLLERASIGACETLRSKPKGDPIVTWGRHFPVEREGFLARLSSLEVSANEVSKRASALREGSYEVVDCGDALLLWVEASGSCRALQQSPGGFLDLPGLSVVACFTSTPGECGSPQYSPERCRYLVAPLLEQKNCGASTPEQREQVERRIIELGLAAPGSSPCSAR